MKKFWLSMLLAVALFTVSATTIFAQDAYEENDQWYQAKPISNPGLGQSGQVVFGTFHDNLDPDYYAITTTPGYNRQAVIFNPPDDQFYIFAVYKKSDFETKDSVPAVGYDNVSGGRVGEIHFESEPGVTYLIFVMNTDYYNNSTGTYMIATYQYTF
jgi:hypothetical protein